MAKTLKTVALVVGVAALVVVTAGAAAGVAAGVGLAASVEASVAALGIVTGLGSAIAGGLALVGAASALSMLQKKPKVSPSQTQRLLVSLVTDTPRTILFGETALATDCRYEEWFGPAQDYFSQVLLCASHWCEAIEQIWINTDLAWTATGGAQGQYVGYLVAQAHAQAATGSTFTSTWSGRWASNAVFTGCATLYVEYKVTGNTSKASSPFSSGIPSRITVRGKAARVYDPRRDSTVGGSGTMRATDQSTWAYTSGGTELGRNPALCLLFYLLGWRIQNPTTGTWKLAVGRGVPGNRIDFDSFITAANLCDELVYKGDGTQEPRYRCDGAFSEADDPPSVYASFEGCMNGKLRDWGGKLALQLFHDDLSTPVVDFGFDDVLGAVDWDGGADIPKNVVKGQYTNPSDSALYQPADYPSVSLTSLDEMDRIDSFDTPLVQSPDQSQRLAKMRLERSQYPGNFSATMNAKGWGVKDGDPVRLTFPALGFSNKLFRVDLTTIDVTGSCPMRLIEENSAIYAAFSDTRAVSTPAVPNTFDPTLLPIPAALANSLSIPRGPWVAGTEYDAGDTVTFNGSTYACILTHTSATANEPPDATYWVLVASKGDPGDPGSPGATGLNNVVIRIFKRAASTPALPSATTTYNFTTGVLTGLNNGWATSVPAADGNPLFESAATASAAGTSDTIASGDWAGAILSTGAGVNTATVWIYQRKSSVPSLPSASCTYTFSTGALTGLNSGWSTSSPDHDGNPLYYSFATALAAAATDAITSGEWETVQILAQDGADGSSGGGSLPASRISTIGTTQLPPITVLAGQTVSFTTHLLATVGSGTSTVTCLLQYTTDGTHWSNMPGGSSSGSGTANGATGDPAIIDLSGSYTNLTGSDVTFEARAASSFTGGTPSVAALSSSINQIA